jgi:hypothetical protein
MEVRFSFTIAEHGFDVEAAERFLDGFLTAHPETGPVVSQNIRTGELSVTFSVDAEDVLDAVQRAREVFLEGATASGLMPTPVIEISAAAVREPTPQTLAERQPIYA